MCLRLKQFVSGERVADWTGDETRVGARKVAEAGFRFCAFVLPTRHVVEGICPLEMSRS
jgi:hypothetical protein